MRSESSTHHACPCGHASDFQHCCAPVIANPCAAQTAEQLMRSRYTAFATGNARHLLASHQATAANCSDLQLEQLQAELQGREWLALRLHRTERGGARDETGVVEFTAYYRNTRSNTDKADIGQLHERSLFVRENGYWLYVDGDSLPPIPLGRNDACWCGSGRKYKKCHLEMA